MKFLYNPTSHFNLANLFTFVNITAGLMATYFITQNNFTVAIILAWIGLHRLDLLKDIPHTQKLSLDMMIPPMGQAALGIEIVCGNDKVREIAESLKDEDTFICTQIE